MRCSQREAFCLFWGVTLALQVCVYRLIIRSDPDRKRNMKLRFHLRLSMRLLQFTVLAFDTLDWRWWHFGLMQNSGTLPPCYTKFLSSLCRFSEPSKCWFYILNKNFMPELWEFRIWRSPYHRWEFEGLLTWARSQDHHSVQPSPGPKFLIFYA